MAEQRRYNADQERRIRESGEAAPQGMSLPSRILRNAAVALPRGVTDLAAAAALVVPAVKAGLSSEVDFPEALYGKEGVSAIQSYVGTKTDEAFAQLPPEKQTERNRQAIQDAVANSQGAEDVRLQHSSAPLRNATQAGNYINELAGLEPVRKETIVDDASQIAASALVPSAFITKPLTKMAAKSALGTAARVAADVIVPGTAKYTPTGIAANVALPLAVSQGLRTATDQPSVFTGDALGPEYGISGDTDPDMGMGGDQLAQGAMVGGAIATAAAIMSGKANKTATKALLDQIDNGAPVPEAEGLTPSLSRGQRIKSEFVDGSTPLTDTVRNAYDERSVAREAAAQEVERVTTNTANVNLNTQHTNAMELGNIPALDRKSVPLMKLARAVSEMPPPEQELFNRYMQSKTLLDRHQLDMKSIDDELRDAKLNLSSGQGSMARVKAIEARKAETAGDDFALIDGMSVKEARELASGAQINPKLMQIEAGLRQLSSDIIDAKLADGQISKETADWLRKNHPNHMMLQDDPQAGMTSMGKWWDQIKNQFKGTKAAPMYSTLRGPLLARTEDVRVKAPMDVMKSYKQYLYDHVQYTAQNEATRTYVNALKDTKDWGRTIREIDSLPIDEYHVKGEPSKFTREKNTFAYTENGRIHFMQAADPEVVRALQFNAPATAAVFNLSRKIAQQGTTGIGAPEFAPTAALFEDGIARVTRQPGRSYGIGDAVLRRAFPDSQLLSNFLDKLGGTPLSPINTSQLQMLAGIFQQIKQSSMLAAGRKIADDLEAGSGLFNMLAQSPGGRQTLEAASEAMLRSFNDSRYGMFVNEGIRQSNLLDDPLKQVRGGFQAADHMMKSAAKPVQFAFKTYMNMLEMVHNSSKYAFFAQNVAALQRKHGGKIPKAELDKLVGETKSLSGDMTRSVGNETFSKVLSSIPYGQVAVNSTYHLASAIKHDPTNVGARILTGAVLPKIAAIGLISSIPALNDWYWNQIPAWQRMSKIPVIGPDWWIDLAQGNARELTENDIYLMPEAPELTPITNSMVTALRTMGAFSPESEMTSSFAKELGEGIENISSIGTPPLISAIATGRKIDLGRLATGWLTGKTAIDDAYLDNPHQGFNVTGINADSDFSRAFSSAINSLFGVAASNAVNSIDVGKQALEDGDSVMQAFGKAFKFDALQRERRLAEIPGTRETGAYLFTNGQRRRYASTQQRERVVEVMNKFEPVMRQLTVDKDKSGANMRAGQEGLDPLATIQDPQMRVIAQEMSNALMKGKMKALSDDRTDLNKDLVRIEANRERISPLSYHERVNSVMTKMNAINKSQEDVIMQLESNLLHRYGIDIDGAIEAIGQSVGR